jgi:hypothetical protein
MKTKLIFTAILLVAFVFTGCEKSNDEFQEDVTSIQKKKPKERPFKSSGTTYAVGGGEQCINNTGNEGSTFEFAGEGKATHMGNVTVTGAHCTFQGCGDGLFTYVAANGDELYSAYEAPCTVTQGFPYVTIEDETILVGGTGRFEDATGSTYLIIVLNIDPSSPDFLTSTWEADGTICY